MLQRADALYADFVPGDVRERHSEISRLAAALEPAVDGDPADHALLFGPSGAGKTCSAKYVKQQIDSQHLGVHTTHIDCWEFHTRGKAIAELCRGCGQGAILHQQLAHDKLLDRIRAVEDPYIVILDEVDQLDDLTLLRELYGMAGVTVVGIANQREDLTSRADEWLRTRVRSCVSIEFDTYSDSALQQILQRRADVALDPGAVGDDELRAIARRAAGNAGLAIAGLRKAARRADQQGISGITDACIEYAMPAAERERRQQSISRLTHEQRLLFEQLPEDGEWLRSEALYQRYQEATETERPARTRRQWLDKMEHYNLVEQRGEGRGTEYRRVLVDVEPARTGNP